MVAKKQTTGGGTGTPSSGRKPWKKKTAVEVVMEQADKLRAQIAEKEEELKELRKQVQKFDEARKLFDI